VSKGKIVIVSNKDMNNPNTRQVIKNKMYFKTNTFFYFILFLIQDNTEYMQILTEIFDYTPSCIHYFLVGYS